MSVGSLNAVPKETDSHRNAEHRPRGHLNDGIAFGRGEAGRAVYKVIAVKQVRGPGRVIGCGDDHRVENRTDSKPGQSH